MLDLFIVFVYTISGFILLALRIMGINHTLTILGMAAGLSLSSGSATPIATQQQKDKKKLLEAIADDPAGDNSKIITFDEAKNLQLTEAEAKQLIEEELVRNEQFRDEIENLQKKYGKASISKELLDLIITISRNPEHFGSFDGEGNYSADEEKVMQALKYGGISEEESQKYKLGMTALLGWICLITWGIMIRNKRKEHTGQKNASKNQK